MPVKNDGEKSDGGDVSDSNSNSSSTSAEEPESDESEMDEIECERRRTFCLDNLTHLERQFTILKEQLYKEKMNQVDWQLSEVRCGRSQEYLLPLQELDDNLKNRVDVAEKLKRFRIENINHKFLSEEQASRQHYESEKQLAMDQIHEELMEKIRRLEEDRHNVDISWADWGTEKRTNKTRGGPGRKKAVTVSGPYIVYMLRDEDILEDWTTIRKAQQRSAN